MGVVIKSKKPHWIALYTLRHESIGAAPKPQDETLAMNGLMRAARAYFTARRLSEHDYAAILNQLGIIAENLDIIPDKMKEGIRQIADALQEYSMTLEEADS